MRQRSLKRRCGGDGTGPRAGREAWEFEVLLLEEDLEGKGPAALMCSSGSGSLLPLFLICRDVKSSITQLCKAEPLLQSGSGVGGLQHDN